MRTLSIIASVTILASALLSQDVAELKGERQLWTSSSAEQRMYSAAIAGATTSEHTRLRFWTKQQIAWQSVNAGLHIFDAVQSCQHVHPMQWNAAHTHWTQGRELTAPFQSCAGIAAWALGDIPFSIGVAYALHRAGHDRLALLVPQVSAGADALSIGYSFTWHNFGSRR